MDKNTPIEAGTFDETFYKMALQYQKNLGNQTIKKLLKIFGTATEIFKQSALQLYQKGVSHNVPRPTITQAIKDQVESEQEWMEQHRVQFCFYTDAHYPRRLKNCLDAPHIFYYQGNSDFNQSKSLAIVGTRNMSGYGCDSVKKIISELSPYKVSIVSGLAFGIDTAAHRFALDYGQHTIAVMGSGFKHIYPTENRKLAERIVDNGGILISEFPFNTLPDRMNFPQRNRIIAGISDATLVAESAKKGGSIITAAIASSYNRDVFAMPGSIFAQSYEGCHELIRTNVAAIAYSGEELAAMMGWTEKKTSAIQKTLFAELDEHETEIVSHIQQQGQISIDELATRCPHFTPSKMAGLLLGLELKGVVECLPGKIYRC